MATSVPSSSWSLLSCWLCGSAQMWRFFTLSLPLLPARTFTHHKMDTLLEVARCVSDLLPWILNACSTTSHPQYPHVPWLLPEDLRSPEHAGAYSNTHLKPIVLRAIRACSLCCMKLLTKPSHALAASAHPRMMPSYRQAVLTACLPCACIYALM